MTRSSYFAPGVYVEEVPSARQPIAGVGTNTVAFIGCLPGDTIWIPVPNPDYDPVAARVLADFKRLQASGDDPARLEAAKLELQNRKGLIDADVEATKKQLEAANRKVADRQTALTKAEDKQKSLGAGADAAATAAANGAVTKAQQALKAAKEEVTNLETARKEKEADSKDLQSQIDGAAAGAGGAGAAGGGAAAGAGGAAGAGAAGGGAAGAGGGGAAAGGAAGAADEEDLTYDDIERAKGLDIPSRVRPYYLKPFKLGVGEFETKLCTNFTQYADRFGSFSAFTSEPVNPADPESQWRFKPLHPGHHYLTHAVNGFFNNGGTRCFVAYVKRFDTPSLNKVLARFASIDDVAIIAAPGLPKTPAIWDALESYCEDDAHQNVFAILDSQGVMDEPGAVNDTSESSQFDVTLLEHAGDSMPRQSNHAAFYFPWIEVVDAAKQLQDSDPARGVSPKYRGHTHVAPSGHMAGVYARTDEERGVHKAPANAIVRGALGVKYYVSKPVQELLNPQGVNCIRIMNGNVTVWGARTVGGDMNGEWKYVSVRRFAGFLEESIDQGTQWVVFEPNEPGLWSKIILNITAFLTNVWRSGALFGTTPQEAFYVKCDAELNPPEVRDLGMVITEIGVAIVRPAEFVIFRISQSTSQSKG